MKMPSLRLGYVIHKMADQVKGLVVNIFLLSSLTAVLSIAADIFMALLLQLQNQQEMLVAQCSGRTDRWWINLWQGHLMEEEWSTNL